MLRRNRNKAIEREKIERLEKAERELFWLKARAARAIMTIDERKSRNHWREAIERMIQGA